MNEIALIVPTMIKFDLFMRLIHSVDYPVRPYISDNSKNNLGVAASWNKEIKNAMADGYKYAIIANDDIEFAAGTMEALVHGIKTLDAVTISPNSQLLGRDTDYYIPRNGYIEGSEYACYAANLERMVDEAGIFDENFYPAYYEDNDMNYRIKLSGGKELINTEVGIIHHGSATGWDVVSPERWYELEDYYISKWGGKPREEKWTTPYNNSDNSIKHWEGNDG